MTQTSRTFRVVGFAEGAIRIPEGFPTIQVDWPDGPQILSLKSEYEGDKLGYRRHMRVRATVDLPAADLDDAISLGMGLAQDALSLAAFLTRSHSGSAKLWVAYETTPGIKERDFLQIVYPEKGMPERATRPVPVREFRQVFKTKFALDPRRGRAAAANALWWFDRAMGEQVPVHRYSSFWLALESIEKQLKAHFKPKPDMGKCAKCGGEYPKQTAIGIRALFQALRGKLELTFGVARDVRVKILHGVGPLSQANEKARRHLTELQAAAENGIYVILGVDASKAAVQPVLPLPASVSYFAVLRGKLQGEDPSSLGIGGEEPHYQFVPFGTEDSEATVGPAAFRFGTVAHVSVPAQLALSFADELNVQQVVVDGTRMR